MHHCVPQAKVSLFLSVVVSGVEFWGGVLPITSPYMTLELLLLSVRSWTNSDGAGTCPHLPLVKLVHSENLLL